jgi:ribosomal protein S27AE
MGFQSACHAEEAVSRDLGRPNCPRCGSVLLVAEHSAFNVRGCIRHVWACDECEHEFVTSIRLWSR